MGRDEFSDMMFASYCGYIIFELVLLYITYQNIRVFFVDNALRIFLAHHIVALLAGICLARGEDPKPHYIGLLNLGNEFVVVSYSLIVIYKKLAMDKHWFVTFNVMSLPLQYFARQILFIYSTYYFIIHKDEIGKCGFYTFWGFAGGLFFMAFMLNPFWLYETIVDAQEHRKAKQN